MAGSASLFYGEGEFAALSIEDELFGAKVGFSYDLSRDVKGAVTYAYSSVDSTSASRDYTRNAVFIDLTTEF